MIDKGFLITSMDEEGNLNDYGYEGDAKTRFSNQTIEQSTAVFGWGIDDVEALKKTYPKYSHKIHLENHQSLLHEDFLIVIVVELVAQLHLAFLSLLFNLCLISFNCQGSSSTVT